MVIGHDWGAMPAAGLAAMPDSPFATSVIMSVPPLAAFQPWGRAPDQLRLLAQIPSPVAAQLVHHVLPIALVP